jgi:hypothetical protein
MSYEVLIPFILKVAIMLTVFSLGLNTNSIDITYLFHKPTQLLKSLLSMNIIMLYSSSNVPVQFLLSGSFYLCHKSMLTVFQPEH